PRRSSDLDGGVELTRVLLVAVGADKVEPDPDGAPGPDDLGVPHLLVEALEAAMEVVGVVVDVQLVGHAVEGDPAEGDPVGVAAGDAAEVGIARAEVALEVAEAEGDVGLAAMAGGHRGRRGG